VSLNLDIEKQPKKLTVSNQKLMWSNLEDKNLLSAIIKQPNRASWVEVAEFVKTRTSEQCRQRHIYLRCKCKIHNNRPWIRKDDINLLKEIEHLGKKPLTAKQLKSEKLRLSRSLRNSSINLWTRGEDIYLEFLHYNYGNAWTFFTTKFEYRSASMIHQRWNVLNKKFFAL